MLTVEISVSMLMCQLRTHDVAGTHACNTRLHMYVCLFVSFEHHRTGH